MPLKLIFWILMLIDLFFGVIPAFQRDGAHWAFGGSLLEFVLFFILGWKSFGPAVE